VVVAFKTWEGVCAERIAGCLRDDKYRLRLSIACTNAMSTLYHIAEYHFELERGGRKKVKKKRKITGGIEDKASAR